MSVKLPKRLSSKKKKLPKDNVQPEILQKLGLEACSTAPLDPSSILDISTWTLENHAPRELKDLPNAFLRRLWLLSQDARSPCIQPEQNGLNKDNASPTEELTGFESTKQSPIHPLDLVTSVFLSANTFLQQEMTVHMMQCKFAVPLVLPNVDPEEPSHFLLWPLRAVVSRWWSHTLDMNRRLQEGNLASMCMPIVSCVKFGHCNVSKSKVLNHVLNGLKPGSETFVHKGMDGGQLPRKLSNGLVEIGWHLPTGDINRDIFPVPVVISNLRGNASTHEKSLSLLCQASSAVVVFCGDLREKDKQLLVSCKDIAKKIILIDFSETDKQENRVVEFVGLEEQMGLPKGSVLPGGTLSEEDVASKLCENLKNLFPDKLKLVTLEAAATLAVELGLNVDEGPVCKKAMATVEEVLRGLDEGPAEYWMKQFPLQGPLWSKLGELDKMESKQRKEGNIDPQLQKQKKDIFAELSSYRITPAMKLFTDALFTTDKMERSYFLTWLKLRLDMMQTKEQNNSQEVSPVPQTENKSTGNMPENLEDIEHGAGDSNSFCSVSAFQVTEGQPENTEMFVSEQQCEIVQELCAVIQSAVKTTESPSDNTNSDIQNVEITEDEVSFEDQNSHQVSEDQICNLDSETVSCKEKHLDITEITRAVPKLAPPAEQQMCNEVSSENQATSNSQPVELDPYSIGLEHFLREMGLMFELTHISPSSGNQNILRLPSVATDLLLYGVPLEIMDGNASNIPMCWLGCIFAELKRRLAQEHLRTRVLTNLGMHNAKNAEVLSALFGVKFPYGGRTTNRGVYMAALAIPSHLKKDMECDLLLLMDVEGLCSFPVNNKESMLIHDNEMTTVAIGLSDVLVQNISQHSDENFETAFSVMVNGLLRTKECGSLPICQILAEDKGINSILQASQTKHIYDMLLTESEDRRNVDNGCAKTTSSASFVKGPWTKMFLSEPVDTEYSMAVLKLKQNLFESLKRCTAKSEASGLPEFMAHLCAVWDAVKSESFSIGLENMDVASAFTLLCTEFFQWKQSLLENIESWLLEASTKIFATKAKALDSSVQNSLLNGLKNEAQEEVKSEVNKVKSKAEAYLMKDDIFKVHAETFKPILMSNVSNLQEQVMEQIMKKLDTINEIHCSSTQLKKFESMLEEEQEFKLLALVETSKSTKILLQDNELEEEFDIVWSKTVAEFDFRPSETDDITTRVRDVLRQNLIHRSLQKHMKKLDIFGQNQTSDFQVHDEHFGYRSRLKHMFEDNNRQQRLEAQQLAWKILDEYKQFVEHKCSLPADFSDSYIVELLETVEKALGGKSMEIRSAFEVDLKLHLCNAACQDFQKLHDRFAKDKELLFCISAAKANFLAEFIYNFRKRDECQRLAKAFTSMVITPTVLDYIKKPLGMQIAEQIKDKAKQYRSPQAFQQSLLEELIKEDHFESFKEYLLSYDNFRLMKIQETVEAHLSESNSLSQWRQQRLGEIIGKISAAVSQTPEGLNGALSDTKPLLERACLVLEEDADIDVGRASLNGPLFSITTDWDRFVKCVMELLATLRLDLGQEFSQNVDINQLLNSLSVQPQDYLFKKVRGCDKKCPLCGAPCEVDDLGHEVHKALLHRPKGLILYDSSSLPCTSWPESQIPGKDDSAKDKSVTCKDLHSLHPNWSNSSDDPDRPEASVYWRYVLTRFSEKFAKEFQQEPAKIPEEWRKITQEEALDNLKEVFEASEN
ncbi:interferon-induced very large GTPase 1 [Cololabis saira]|uniref:interferon-induced very large GTPase 1 n=1 Tax=Cololabis saira TaxID=129043 RepID=UPI002AD4D5CB|nr:interferon-induced very large GTPase 1 [Cololabis saira]